ncbi:hypothetical protein ACWGH4_00565 [Streptomyces sp. NPDC054847]
MKLRRALAILTLTTAGVLGSAAAASACTGGSDTSTVVEDPTGTDDSAWGTPPADEPAPEPTEDGTDTTVARDSAWG